MHLRNGRLFAISMILLCAAVAASAKPNFSGEWKLNISKSEFGEMPAPTSMTQKVTHEEPKLTVAVKQSGDNGDFDWEANYTTDGTECKNNFHDNPFVSVLKWDGDVLTMDTKGKFGETDFTMKSKWTLSSDGKVLTIENHFSSSYGEGDQKMVLEKQ